MKRILVLEDPCYWGAYKRALEEEDFDVVMLNTCVLDRMHQTEEALEENWGLIIIEPENYGEEEHRLLQKLLRGKNFLVYTVASDSDFKATHRLIKPTSIDQFVKTAKRLVR